MSNDNVVNLFAADKNCKVVHVDAERVYRARLTIPYHALPLDDFDREDVWELVPELNKNFCRVIPESEHFQDSLELRLRIPDDVSYRYVINQLQNSDYVDSNIKSAFEFIFSFEEIGEHVVPMRTKKSDRPEFMLVQFEYTYRLCLSVPYTVAIHRENVPLSLLKFYKGLQAQNDAELVSRTVSFCDNKHSRKTEIHLRVPKFVSAETVYEEIRSTCLDDNSPVRPRFRYLESNAEGGYVLARKQMWSFKM